MIVSDAIVVGFQNEIKSKIIGFGSHIQVSKTKSNLSFESEPLERKDSLINAIESNPKVSHIQTFATKPAIIKSANDIEGIILKGVDAHYDWKFYESYIISGRKPVISDTGLTDEILVSKSTADQLNLKLGNSVIMYFIQDPPKVRKFRISGIFETGVEEVDKFFIICDLKQIQRLNGWKDNQISGYEISLKNEEDLENANEEIRQMTDVSVDTRTIKERYPQIFDWLNLLNDNIRIILILMGIVAAINMITALMIMIFERTQMIGVLKSLGGKNSTIQKIFIYNAMILIGLGILLGNIVAISFIIFQGLTHFISLAQESYYVSFVPVKINVGHIILINVGAFIFCTLAILIPSMLVSRISPAKTLRFE